MQAERCEMEDSEDTWDWSGFGPCSTVLQAQVCSAGSTFTHIHEVCVEHANMMSARITCPLCGD